MCISHNLIKTSTKTSTFITLFLISLFKHLMNLFIFLYIRMKTFYTQYKVVLYTVFYFTCGITLEINLEHKNNVKSSYKFVLSDFVSKL